MEENARARNIISQAAQWSFEGDCSLLAWMQELSQNLEQRATVTSDAMQQLSVDVNRMEIALDNAANSLTALQYTQFVESRCHDDDETLTNSANARVEVRTTQSTEIPRTSNEVLETFLRKNLQMLHNSHEKYALDFEDSDEEEGATTSNCIYQPKNPYNDALLPHIYGSKLWKEHWHVGLCDGSNEYSGDEASDAFSVSSSSSAADNESYESNTANLSEWASSTSIPIEHRHPAQVAAQKESVKPNKISGTAPNMRLPLMHPQFSPNDDSDTCSTTSRSTTTNPPIRQTVEHDLFAALRHGTPSTGTPSSESMQQPISAVQGERNEALAPQTLPSFINATPPTDIFADVASSRHSIGNRETDTIPRSSAASQIKGKPVNLFDDDDFNSFMTEVEDKPQTKADLPVQLPVPATRKLPNKYDAELISNEVIKPKTVDLFAEPLNNKMAAVNQPTAKVQTEKPKEIMQRKPINLFESPEGSPPNDSVFSYPTISETNKAEVLKSVLKTKISAKSLFDDDEDDDDFLNVFGSKKISLPQGSEGKTLLFDDDREETSQPTKRSEKITSNIFDHTRPADDELESSATLEKLVENKAGDNSTKRKSASALNIHKDSITQVRVDLFDNFEDTSKAGAQSQKLDAATVKPNNKLFGGDLFADEDSDDLDDLFRKQLTSQQSTKSTVKKPIANVSNNPESTKSNTQKIVQGRKPLFGQEFEDDDDLFKDRLAKIDDRAVNNVANNNEAKVIESPKIDIPKKSFTGTVAKTIKNTSLFADNFEDVADDLFGKNVTAKQILNNGSSTDNRETKDSIQTALLEHNAENKSPVKQTIVEEVLKTPALEVPATGLLKSAGVVYEQRALFEDDFENTEAVLFNKSNEKLLPEASNETNSNARKPESIISAADELTGAMLRKSAVVASIDERQSKTAFDENASDFAFEISTSNVVQEIHNSSAIEQSGKTNKASNKEKSIEHAGKEGITETPAARSEFETALQPNKDINTAEPSLKISNQYATDAYTQPLPAVTETETHNHEYPSIFLDEPPDDDDFFTTLSNNSQPLSVSKLTLDLESDFYEPALPATPSTGKTAAHITAVNNQLEGNSKQQPSSSDYGGLRLFSEIPPDDDDDDFSFAAPSSKYAAENALVNQRLHSVFYDDFPETLEAVQQIKERQITAHALFNGESSPDDVMENLMQTNIEKDIEKVSEPANQAATAKTNSFESINDVNKKQSTNSFSATLHSNDVTDRAPLKVVDAQSLPVAVKPRSSAGKLQIPNIKINVQALLPGGGGRPNFKKSITTPESTKPADTRTEPIPESSNAIKEEPMHASITSATPSKPANENVLPSVCKTRVRAPAGRRPSTRRARQENYRQSLIAEQEDNQEIDDSFESLPQTKAPSSNLNELLKKEQAIKSATKTFASNAKDDGNVLAQTYASSSKAPSALTQSHSRLNANLFEDDDDALFGATHISNANIPGKSVDLNTPKLKASQTNTEKSIARARPVQVAGKIRPTLTKDFATNRDDAADELFKGGHATPIDTAIKSSNNTATTANVSKSLFDTPPSEESDDDLFKSSKTAVATLVRPTTTTQATTTTASVKPPAKTTATNTGAVGGKLDSIFGSDDEDDDFFSNLKPKKKAKTTLKAANATGIAKQSTQSVGGLFSDIESDEDDLFGGKSNTQQETVKANSNITVKAQLPPAGATQKQTKSTTASNKPASLADNPLADLLNP